MREMGQFQFFAKSQKVGAVPYFYTAWLFSRISRLRMRSLSE